MGEQEVSRNIALNSDEREYLTFLLEQGRPEGNEIFRDLRTSILGNLKIESDDESVPWSRYIRASYTEPLVNEDISTEAYQTLIQAIHRRSACRITYYELLEDGYLPLRMTPLQLRYIDESWSVLFLTDEWGGDNRVKVHDLKFDEIGSVTLLDECDFEPEASLDELMDQYGVDWNNTTHLKLMVEGLTADWARKRLWGANQKIHELDQFKVIIDADVNDRNVNLFRLLLSFGDDVTVLEPVNSIRITMSNGLRIYKKYLKEYPEFKRETELDALFESDVIFRTEGAVIDSAKDYNLPGLVGISREKILCSADERAQLEPLAELMEEMLMTVREKRILSINSEYDWLNLKPAFLSEALGFVLEGLYVDELEKVLNSRIEENNYKGKELLEKIIIRDGCLAIAKRMNPVEFKHHMQLLLEQ